MTRDDLMRYLDGELPPERARELEAALERDTELARELAVYRSMKQDLGSMGETMRTNGTVWEAVNRRLTRPVGWTLFLVGTLVWLAYGVYTYLTGGVAMWEKLATSAVAVGLAMLLLSAMIDRYRDLKSDPYKEIER